jgi:hypothetical protein
MKALISVNQLKVKVKVAFTGPIQHCSLMADCTLAPKWFLPSSPEALRTKRRERPLPAKEGSLTHEFCQGAGFFAHAPKLGHGADYLTSPPKEGMLRFLHQKNPTASPGFEPANSGTRGQHANH